MGFTSNLLAGVVFKSIQNDMIMAMFLEFYNQKFNENIINTKEYLPFGESETNTWQTRDESINSWFDKRIQFLKDWEQAIINGEFQSEYISEDELTTNGFEKNSLLL
jgi:hypothetical protein